MSMRFREKLYQYLSDTIEQQNYTPSFKEMTHAMGISPRSKSLITRSLRTLQKEGRLRLKKDGRRLSIALGSEHLPLLGYMTESLAMETISDGQFFDVTSMLQSQDQFVLQVKGEGMVEDGILPGDILICRYADEVKEGDTVIALIDQRYTSLKRISYQVQNMITLIPLQANVKPRAYPPSRIIIQGIFLCLLRYTRNASGILKKHSK